MRLYPADEQILRHLHEEGRNLGANIAPQLDRDAQYVGNRLRQMEDYGLTADIGHGVYEITTEGRAALELFEHRDREDFEARVETRAETLQE